MYGVLPGAVFDGAPLTPPRGVVKSTWGNHQFTDGFELMHQAWRSIEEVLYYFSRSSINFKVTQAEKSKIWIQIEYDYQAGRSYQISQILFPKSQILYSIFPVKSQMNRFQR